MANKRKDRKRYNKGSRQDYTQGGRVGYREGDEVEELKRNALRAERVDNRRGQQEAQQMPNASSAPTTTTTSTAPQTQVQNQQVGEATPAPTPAPKTQAQIEEEARLKAEADRLEAEEARLASARAQLIRDTTADRERTARIQETADTITQSAQGVVPESAVIPDAQQVSTDIPTTTTTKSFGHQLQRVFTRTRLWASTTWLTCSRC